MKISTNALLGAVLASISILIAIVSVVGLRFYVIGSMPASAFQKVVSQNEHLISEDEGAHLWLGEWTDRRNEVQYANVPIAFPPGQVRFSHPPQVTVGISGYSFAQEHGLLQADVVPGSVTRDGFVLLVERRKRDSELHWMDVQWVAVGD